MRCWCCQHNAVRQAGRRPVQVMSEGSSDPLEHGMIEPVASRGDQLRPGGPYSHRVLAVPHVSVIARLTARLRTRSCAPGATHYALSGVRVWSISRVAGGADWPPDLLKVKESDVRRRCFPRSKATREQEATDVCNVRM